MRYSSPFFRIGAGAAIALVAAAACHKPKSTAAGATPTGSANATPADYGPCEPSADQNCETRWQGLARGDFNRFAVRLNLPLYWIADANNDGAIQPDEVASLLFYPTAGAWVEDGAFTPAFTKAADAILAASQAMTAQELRITSVAQDLDAGRPTLVYSDLSAMPTAHQVFAQHMLKVADLIDELYMLQTGAAELAGQVGKDDLASQSLFRRNRGPGCVAPGTESIPECNAIPGAPKAFVGVYPKALPAKGKQPALGQHDKGFCQALEAHKDAAALLTPFTVVQEQGGKLEAVPYSTAYAPQMGKISAALKDAARALKDTGEDALVTYLNAAAQSFLDNNWLPADEAWAAMNVDNSKWYVRVAPDEVYWEPCAHKAGFHLTFALINQGSIAWQKKLTPIQQDMEADVATRAGKPYKARKVAFHLPDFIDIVVNAGDDRDALGATIGQSLPNWGPVANEGRGRTVAMTNLYADPDSMMARRTQAESLLDATSMKAYTGTPDPGLLSTILHEAMHNLGPAHEYKANGKTDDMAFGGPLASVFEELKAQTGALYLVEFLRVKGVISDEMARSTYTDAIVWAMGHISQGMYNGAGDRKTYSNVSAIQVGFLMDQGALRWDANATAANGQDTGAFVIVADKLIPAINGMMTTVAGIKARADGKAATALAKKYVDGTVVPHAIIRERFLRQPKASFVYAVKFKE